LVTDAVVGVARVVGALVVVVDLKRSPGLAHACLARFNAVADVVVSTVGSVGHRHMLYAADRVAEIHGAAVRVVDVGRVAQSAEASGDASLRSIAGVAVPAGAPRR
jgi:hypothetical protein